MEAQEKRRCPACAQKGVLMEMLFFEEKVAFRAGDFPTVDVTPAFWRCPKCGHKIEMPAEDD